MLYEVITESCLRGLLCEMRDQYFNYFDVLNEKYIAYMLSTIRIESYSYWSNPVVFFSPIAEFISYAKAERHYGCGDTASDENKRRAIENGNKAIGDGSYNFV